VTATTWLLCGWTALASVLKGNYLQHRQWMIRSYAVTTIFVTARVVFALPIIKRLGEPASAPVLWTLLVLTLVFTEFGLAWQSIFASRRPASRAIAAAG
jgi:predicted ABC-type exoprotein transport system permease subunit